MVTFCSYRYWPAIWIRPKLGSFDRTSLKIEARRFLEMSDRSPCWELFKVTTPSPVGVQVCQGPFIYYIQLLATALLTNMESVSNGAMNIFSPGYCLFFVVNSAMNPLWYWHWRNEPSAILTMALWTLRDIDNGAMNPPRYWQRGLKPLQWYL